MAVDKLSRKRRILLPHLPDCRRILLLQGREIQTHTALPLQRGAYGRGRKIFLYKRRRLRLVAVLEAGTDSAGLLRMPARYGLHKDMRREERPECRSPVLRASGQQVRDTQTHSQQQDGRKEELQTLLLRGVVPVERGHGYGKFPAQPLYGRGGDTRFHHIPQDRIQGKAQPLRLLLREQPDRRLRHGQGKLPRRIQRIRRA